MTIQPPESPTSASSVEFASRLDDSEKTGGASLNVTSIPPNILETPLNGEKDDLENFQDGLLRQSIEKEGREVVITWTKEEEARVVRKVDFLFLPLFSVSAGSLLKAEVSFLHCNTADVCLDGDRSHKCLWCLDVYVLERHENDKRPSKYWGLTSLVWHCITRNSVKCEQSISPLILLRS